MHLYNAARYGTRENKDRWLGPCTTVCLVLDRGKVTSKRLPEHYHGVNSNVKVIALCTYSVDMILYFSMAR